MMRSFRSPTINRIVFAMICLLISLTGAANLFQGRLEYHNYKGFSVFAPFAILVGFLGLVLVIARPAFFSSSDKKRNRSSAQPTSPTHAHRKRR